MPDSLFRLVFRLLIIAISVVIAVPTSQAASRVIIKAEASVDYERAQAGKNKDRTISYHFVEGKFFKGHANDGSLTHVTFLEIAENLAGHLAKQNYVPTGNVKENEVMILVNWGVTAVEDSVEELYGLTSPDEYDEMFGSPVTSEDSSGEVTTTYEPSVSPNWGAMGKRENSKMLGFWNTLHDGSLMPTEHYDLQALLNEERYFIVVIAFDNQKFLKNQEKEILWVTRFSMRATGISFNQAFPELTATASDYFGKHVKGLTRKRSDDDSHVEVGEIEVIDAVDENEISKRPGEKP